VFQLCYNLWELVDLRICCLSTVDRRNIIRIRSTRRFGANLAQFLSLSPPRFLFYSMVVSATTPLLPPKPLHAVPVAERPSGHRYFKSLLFGLVFDTSLICINGTQFVFFPLRLIPLKVTRDLYEAAIAYTKSSFGVLCGEFSPLKFKLPLKMTSVTLVLMCQWFAPTSLLITTEGMDESILVRDPETGQVVGLNLPPKLVLMANHQVYCDWWYLWAFTYFLNVHDSVLIILKKSLKWVPVVGWVRFVACV